MTTNPTTRPLNERILDLLVFVPAGFAVSVVEELPKLAVRRPANGSGSGCRRPGRWGSSRSRPGGTNSDAGPGACSTGPRGTAGRSADAVRTRAEPVGRPRRAPVRTVGQERRGDGSPGRPGPRPDRLPPTGTCPPVSTLSIPGFDTLSASQVVQRLDGLNRSELVSVRAYEASTRGRRTILSRVDQLLDERS